jgi:hypothetical protein
LRKRRGLRLRDHLRSAASSCAKMRSGRPKAASSGARHVAEPGQ